MDVQKLPTKPNLANANKVPNVKTVSVHLLVNPVLNLVVALGSAKISLLIQLQKKRNKKPMIKQNGNQKTFHTKNIPSIRQHQDQKDSVRLNSPMFVLFFLGYGTINSGN